MDELIRKIASLGVPGLVLLVAIELAGGVGAAAITAALAAIGPGGMVGGVITLCAIGLITDGLSECGFDALAKGVVRELYCKGETKESIKRKVKKYPISTKAKNNLYKVIDDFSEHDKIDEFNDESIEEI